MAKIVFLKQTLKQQSGESNVNFRHKNSFKVFNIWQ